MAEKKNERAPDLEPLGFYVRPDGTRDDRAFHEELLGDDPPLPPALKARIMARLERSKRRSKETEK